MRKTKKNLQLIRLYQRARKAGFSAKDAVRNARTRMNWDKHEVGQHDEPIKGSVRLRIEPDEGCDIKNLFGDTFNPSANPEIPRARLEREQARETERIERDGVWGVIGEFFDGEAWQHADSCWGFVGSDWKDSGYDVDIMASTLDEAQTVKNCRCCGRPKIRKAVSK